MKKRAILKTEDSNYKSSDATFKFSALFSAFFRTNSSPNSENSLEPSLETGHVTFR